jgi:hypothetical protein
LRQNLLLFRGIINLQGIDGTSLNASAAASTSALGYIDDWLSLIIYAYSADFGGTNALANTTTGDTLSRD